jgi:glycosyltransferase involved in cell wall biosynthesis
VPPPRRIHVHALVDTMVAGGAELLLAELAAVAPAAGIDLTVAHLAEWEGGSPAADRLRERGVEPRFVPVSRLSPAAVRTVGRHLRQVRPDIVHTHLGASDLLGGLAARALGIPAVSTIHSMQWEGPPVERVRQRLMGEARRLCAAKVIAVSDVARARYLAERRDVARHVVVLRNGVGGVPEPGAGARVRAEFGIGADERLVVVLAALRVEKGHDVAIAAVREVRRTRPDVRLLVVGEGGTRPEVEAGVARLGGAGVMSGYRADVMALLDAADVVLQPSYADALPTSLIEAAAASVPVVASRVGGIPEIVEDGRTGVLVPAPPRTDVVAEALGALLDDPARRAAMGAAARERFTAEYSAGAWVTRLRELYDAVLARRAA